MEVNHLYCENCLETMSRMPDGFIDLTVTSPPYDNLRTYNGYNFDFEATAKELYRVTKKGGVVVWVVGDATVNGSESGTSFRQALYFKDVCGFNLHDTMIYHRERLPLTHNRYEQHFEYMFVFSNGPPATFTAIKERSVTAGKVCKTSSFRHEGNKTGKLHGQAPTKELKTKGNVWEYGVGYMKSTTDKRAYDHPAIFPESLARDHILSWSNEGDLVYDPMAGSGTVPKMAIQTKRNWIASEISPEYCEIIERRIKNTNHVMFA
jgi:DNA modification methylase